jgi:TRAP-type uncharacterized transport system substrate-binding protein
VNSVVKGPFAAGLVLGSAFGFAFAGDAAAEDKFVALGTVSPNGTYAPVGSGICDLVNENRAEHGVRCIAYNTGGSVYNIQAITSGEFDLPSRTIPSFKLELAAKGRPDLAVVPV